VAASYVAGQEDIAGAGLRRPPCLRSGRGEGDVTASSFFERRVYPGLVVPFEEDDESPFVGLLQVEPT
jgi:hypothetical protein